MDTPPPLITAPVREGERLASLDVLRGIAVLGILYMNIQSFSMPGAAYGNPTAYGDLGGADLVVWLVGDLFFHNKFLTIFSMLYGAGIVLLTERLGASHRPVRRVHYRRNAVLLLIGVMHAHVLWSGDILYDYAACAMILFTFRNAGPRTLIAAGIVFLAVELAISVSFAVEAGPPDPYSRYAWLPDPQIIDYELETFRGSWRAQMRWRVADALLMETIGFALGTFWWAGGLMLIGMALYKAGFFSARSQPGTYMGWIGVAMLVALPVTGYGVWRNFEAGWDHGYSDRFGWIPGRLASPFMSLGICSVVMLWCQWRTLIGEAGPGLRRALAGLTVYERVAAAGRMALTNYLMQTIICTLLFYGHGLGLFGYLERRGQLAVVLAIWLAQLVYSPLWLRYFRFGPFEWVWRSVTYFKPQPMLR